MKKLFLVTVVVALVSCKSLSFSDKRFSDFKNELPYKLKLNPEGGANYHYDIINETSISFKVEDKEIENSNNAAAGVVYTITKDSSDDLG